MYGSSWYPHDGFKFVPLFVTGFPAYRHSNRDLETTDMRTRPSARAKKQVYRHPELWLLTSIGIMFGTVASAEAQMASPLQSGHYSPTMMNVRDMAYPPAGLFVLWYSAFTSSNSFVDRNGNKFESINLSEINPALPDINVDLRLKALASVPTVFWASNFRILGGARYMVGIAPNFVSADVSIFTERAGIGNPDTSIVRQIDSKNSGFSDFFVAPVGLSWGWEHYDFTAMYSFYPPTGKYETGNAESIGLGFWTHQVQGRGYYYPRPDKATAVMVGLIYEMNGKIKDVDVSPGDRFTLEWGVSQYFSDRFEVAVQGGHNWQVSDDTGNDVYWDPTYHDRKSTVAGGITLWPWKGHLAVTAKYAFDFGVRQRFKNSTLFVNLLFVPNWLTGAPANAAR